MAWGIGRGKRFRNDVDRDDFIDRLENIINDNRTPFLAFVLIRNHFHILLKIGAVPISKVIAIPGTAIPGTAYSFSNTFLNSNIT
jgi:putative transposase